MKQPQKKNSIQASLAQLYDQLDNKRAPEPPPPPRVMVKPRKGGLKSGMKEKRRIVNSENDVTPTTAKKVAFGDEPQAGARRVVFRVEEPPAEVLFAASTKSGLVEKRDIFDHGEAPGRIPKAKVPTTKIAEHWGQLGQEPKRARGKSEDVGVGYGEKGSVHELETIELAKLSTVSLERGSYGSGVDEVEYPTALKLTIIVIALSMAVFCTGLDATIIPVVVPGITDDYKTMQDVGWYGSAYFLASAASQLPYGKLYTFCSIKQVFLYALLLFELSSLICATSHSSDALVAGRAIAGLGSGGVFAGALHIIRHLARPAKRPVYVGIIVCTMALSNIAGPLLGGVISETIDWRWCFWINLPTGLAVSMVLFIFITTPEQKQPRLSWKARLQRLDIPGLVLIVLATTFFLTALEWGGTRFPWRGWQIVLLFCFSVTMLCAFVATQLRLGDMGAIPVSLLKRKEIVACSWLGFCVNGSASVTSFWLPNWFQEIKNASPLESGESMLPQVLGFALFGLLTWPLVTCVGYWGPFILSGTVFMAIGGGMLTTLHTNSSPSAWIGFQCLSGIGYGLCAQAPISLLQEILTYENDVSMATSIVVLWSQLGPLSIDETIFSNSLTQKLARIVPFFESDHRMTLRHGIIQLRNQLEKMHPELASEIVKSYNEAITAVLRIAVVLAALSVLGSLGPGWKRGKRAGEN
ncbi:hypothetical protein FKW77_000692 [Venturia effusa]|uniref:Major facilitator superfamily (MFS) profile domain-containing protein n=1 Tax=Venturia effusa TaxID=50376 RepID=A0A517KVQ2_9PEZI|nr:hypothetical protein FKW77_000692 [Venturia effusa]